MANSFFKINGLDSSVAGKIAHLAVLAVAENTAMTTAQSKLCWLSLDYGQTLDVDPFALSAASLTAVKTALITSRVSDNTAVQYATTLSMSGMSYSVTYAIRLAGLYYVSYAASTLIVKYENGSTFRVPFGSTAEAVNAMSTLVTKINSL